MQTMMVSARSQRVLPTVKKKRSRQKRLGTMAVTLGVGHRALAIRGFLEGIRQGAGLNNLGFTCFLNAVLQCLTHTVPLVQGIRNLDHPNPCHRDKDGFCVLCALRKHIELSIAYSGGVLSPRRFANNLEHISSDFMRYQQEDAHEFQHALLDRLESCCLDSKTMDDDSSPECNLVEQVFGGRLVSKLQCCSCGHCSCTCEPLIDLSLEIEHVDSLSSALESFTNVEKMEDPETKFKCSNCNQEVSIEKQLLLNKEPTVAAFHLKRFKTDGFSVEKIDKHVNFPLELDLQPYTGGSFTDNVELKYQLYAVVVHIGISPTSGHYFSFIRSSPGTWHMFDDSEVRKVDEDLVLAQDAYILFYAKEGTPWFSSLMEAQKLHFNPNLSDGSPKSVLDNMDTPCRASSDVAETDRCKGGEFCVSTEDSPLNQENGCENHGLCKTGGIAVAGTLPCAQDLGRNEVVDSHREDDEPMLDNLVNAEERDRHSETSTSNRGMSMSSQNAGNLEPVKDDGFCPLTPSSSPTSGSPEYTRKTSDSSNEKSQRLKPNHVTCKRQLSKALDDPKRKEALRYIRNMPSSRGLKIIHAMLGQRSPGASRKKSVRRKMGASPFKRASPPSGRPRSRHIHSIAASRIR